MASFHKRGYGFSSQFAVKATAKKMAKSIVGNSMPGSHPLFRERTTRRDRGAWRTRVRLVRADGATRPPHLGPGQPRAFRASINLGTTLWTSPTTPRSATEKMGASWSLLMAMMFFDPFMPTRCWVAPEIPHATYSVGLTVLPVWPTWCEYGTHPAS